MNTFSTIKIAFFQINQNQTTENKNWKILGLLIWVKFILPIRSSGGLVGLSFNSKISLPLDSRDGIRILLLTHLETRRLRKIWKKSEILHLEQKK